MPIYYFGDFDCTNCRAGWQILRAAAARYAGRVRIEFLHHFPEADLALFDSALEAECAGRQGKFADYGEWRTSSVQVGSALDAVGLDGARLEACMSESRTAVSVLEDTAEALRLGFREAVPSWVIGTQLRRGVQGQSALDLEIEEQLEARATQAQAAKLRVPVPSVVSPSPATPPLAPAAATGETTGVEPVPHVDAADTSAVADDSRPAADRAPGARLRYGR
jgi:predicted DsbA family dithiol-disulfide isomerase